MKKELVYWELKFDSMYFAGSKLHNGVKYSNRQDAVEAVNELSRYLCSNYLSRMERKVIHEKHTDNDTGDCVDKYWYEVVAVDMYDEPTLISFGCERHKLILK